MRTRERPRSQAKEKVHRDLDMLIATKVMGYRIAKRKTKNPKHPIAYRWHTKEGEPVFWPANGLFGWGWGHEPIAPPQFSESVSLAWEVVEKLVAGGRKVTIEATQSGGCEVTISGRRGDLDSWTSALSPTMPLAVCRAAEFLVNRK